MKIFLFNAPRRLRFILYILTAGSYVFSGCKPATISDISGAYRRSTNGVNDVLELSTNGTFQQTITYTNGDRWTKTGTWTLNYQVVEIRGFYSPFTLEPFKGKIQTTIPPEECAMAAVWVEKDKLLQDESAIYPIWIKQKK
jgi:hypothetical protein